MPRGEGPTSRLAPSERRVLELAALGRMDKDIAEILGISYGTVRVYRTRVEEKLKTKGLGPCIIRAWKQGDLDLDRLAAQIDEDIRAIESGEGRSVG